jgi:hypothetical protein
VARHKHENERLGPCASTNSGLDNRRSPHAPPCKATFPRHRFDGGRPMLARLMSLAVVIRGAVEKENRLMWAQSGP